MSRAGRRQKLPHLIRAMASLYSCPDCISEADEPVCDEHGHLARGSAPRPNLPMAQRPNGRIPMSDLVLDCSEAFRVTTWG
jgi:hypothetical protein